MEKADFDSAIADINGKIEKLTQNIERINANVNNIAQQRTESNVQNHQAESGSGHLENRYVAVVSSSSDDVELNWLSRVLWSLILFDLSYS